MSNLIITIISIALIAVAAIVGIFYGGNAFQGGSAQAQANGIAAAFSQVAASLVLYEADHGGDSPYSGWNMGATAQPLTAFLVPKYLSVEPVPGVSTKFGGKIVADNYNSTARTVLMLFLNNQSVCAQIEALRTGVVPTTLRNYVVGAGNMDTYFVGQIGCFYDPTPYLDATTAYYIAYYDPNGSPF